MGTFSFDFSGMACTVLTPGKVDKQPLVNILFLSGADGSGAPAPCPHKAMLTMPAMVTALDTFPRDRVSIFHLPGGELWNLLDVTGFEITVEAKQKPVIANDRRGRRRKKEFRNLDAILDLSLIGGGARVNRAFFTTPLGAKEVIASRFTPSGGRIRGGTPSPYCGGAAWTHPAWNNKGIDLNDRLRWTLTRRTSTLTLTLTGAGKTHAIKITDPGSGVPCSAYSLCTSQEPSTPVTGKSEAMRDVLLYNRVLLPDSVTTSKALRGKSVDDAPIKVVPEPDTTGAASIGDPTCPLGMAS